MRCYLRGNIVIRICDLYKNLHTPYYSNFTNHTWSWLLCTSVIVLLPCVDHVHAGNKMELIPRQTFVFTVLHVWNLGKRCWTVNYGKTHFHDNRLHGKGNEDVKGNDLNGNRWSEFLRELCLGGTTPMISTRERSLHAVLVKLCLFRLNLDDCGQFFANVFCKPQTTRERFF